MFPIHPGGLKIEAGRIQDIFMSQRHICDTALIPQMHFLLNIGAYSSENIIIKKNTITQHTIN